jgi:hypothetical protein
MFTVKETEYAGIKEAKYNEEQHKVDEQSLVVQAVLDGDVTDELCKYQDANGKRNLCNALNKDAIRKRDAAPGRQFSFCSDCSIAQQSRGRLRSNLP